jgi:hypothetical protein
VRATAAKAGIICRRAANVVVDNVSVNAIPHPAVAARDVQGLEVHRLRAERTRLAPALVELEHVERALIHGCSATNPDALVKLHGTRNRLISLEANVFTPAAAPAPAPAAAPVPRSASTASNTPAAPAPVPAPRK